MLKGLNSRLHYVATGDTGLDEDTARLARIANLAAQLSDELLESETKLTTRGGTYLNRLLRELGDE